MKLTKEKVLDLLSKITIVEIRSVEKHENADKLRIVKVNGGKEDHQIVTAATNMKKGDLVPWLKPGELVPGPYFKDGTEFKLEAREMRGVMSEGMILAEDEIGLSDDHEGILIISPESKVGDSPLLHPQTGFREGESGGLSAGEAGVGKKLTDGLSDQAIEKICKRAGVIEISPEVQEKIELITRNLQEVVGVEDMAEIIEERPFKIYLGSATTGKPHLGYFTWIVKVADFLKAGCEVTLLLADIHAFLDNMKSTWELLEARTELYEIMFTKMLEVAGADTKNLKFIRGRDYQLKPDYIMDVYKVAALASVRDAKKAGTEVVKQVESPLMSSLLYPILQTVDEEHLAVDAQFGGLDQRKIFVFAREYLPKIGYKKRVHLMSPLIPGFGKSGKMSASEPNSKIDFDDPEEVVKEKINKAFSVDGKAEGNGLIALMRYILFNYLNDQNKEFTVKREEKWGGDVIYKDIEELEKDFAEGNISSVDLKPAIADLLIEFITPMRELMAENKELVDRAYPQ